MSELVNWSNDIFQFHYGTIEAEKLKADRVVKKKFQFHYGTIEARHKNSLINTINALFYFKNKQKNRRCQVEGFYRGIDDC